MEGSIADSTAVRLRSQLQRMHHTSTSTGAADGFLEELLKMPMASQVEADEPAGPTSEVDAAAPTEAVQPGSDAGQSKPESSDEDEPAPEETYQPCIVVCYGPAPIVQPDSQEPVIESSVADERVITPPVSATVEVDAGPAVVEQVSAEKVSVEVVNEDVTGAEVEQSVIVESTTNAAQAPAQALANKSVRDSRRPKETREKPEPTHQPQPQSATNSAVVKPSTPESEPVSQPEAEKTVAAQSVEPSATIKEPAATAESSRHRGDESRGERDKWYETDAPDSAESSNLVDRLQQEVAEPSKDPADQSDSLLSAQMAVETLPITETSPALVADSAVLNSDNTQLAADMAAAAQASLQQTISATTVSETSRGQDVDASSRVRTGAASSATTVTGANPLQNATGARGSGSSTQGTTSTSGSNQEPPEISQQERVRLVQRVARSFFRLGPEGGQVTLKLHPPQLGVLNVSIKIDGQTMTARLQTETSTARDVIVDNLPVLKDRLSEHGIDVEKFQVEVGQPEDFSASSNQSGFSGGRDDSRQPESALGPESLARRAVQGEPPRLVGAPIVEPKLHTWPATDRSLDVRA